MISFFLKSRLRSLQKNNSGAALIEFSFLGGIFLLCLISVMELMIFFVYKATVESAISKGLEITALNTPINTGGFIATHERLRNANNIIDIADVEDNIPDFYNNFLISGAGNFDITADGADYDTTGTALNMHNSYRIEFTATWDPISPLLRMGGNIPITLIVHYNDY